MKSFFLFFVIIFLSAANYAQEHKLEKIWETDTVIAVPESVLPDSKNGILYVSLINGGSWDADAKGGVAKLSVDGKTYDSTWITSLSAPKGLGIVGNRLYVADITNVVVIDIQKGAIEKKIAIDSAVGLNDITVTDRGIIYVSDSRAGKIYRIENDIPSLYLDNVKGVNGLKAVRDELMIGAGKSFFKSDIQKQLTLIVELPQSIDGIEPVGNGDYIVTSWGGYIFYVSGDGKFETLLDTHVEKMNTADIGFNPEKKIVYVPTFNAKRVIAYSLK